MQQQTKDDLKAAWQAALPSLKRLALNVASVVGAVLWACVFIWLICTQFWVGMIQLAVTIVIGNVALNYWRIVSNRQELAEAEARAAERAKRRGY